MFILRELFLKKFSEAEKEVLLQSEVVAKNRIEIPQDTFFHVSFISENAYINAIRRRQYITAQQLWSTLPIGIERELAAVETLRQLPNELNLALDALLRYTTFSGLIRELKEDKSYMLLLWIVFPRLLLMYPDLIHALSLINRPGEMRRSTADEDVGYLRQIHSSICIDTDINKTYYYQRELLETIERLSGCMVDQISEMENTDYPLQEGILYKDYELEIETARQIATAFCSSRVIVVFDHAGGDVIIKDIALSGPRIVRPYHTTYQIVSASLSSEEHDDSELMTQPVMKQERLRTITTNELMYLKSLRWQCRRPALLLASKCCDGRHFHVLKLVARFL
jgi:hypothetical protein